MDTGEGAGRIFGKVNEPIIFLNILKAFGIGAPHSEKWSFETVRLVRLMKARPNCPTHLISVTLPAGNYTLVLQEIHGHTH